MGNQPKQYYYGGKLEEVLRLEAQGKVYHRLLEKEICLLAFSRIEHAAFARLTLFSARN